MIYATAAIVLALFLIPGYLGVRISCRWGRKWDPLSPETFSKGVYAKNGDLLFKNSTLVASIPAEHLYLTSYDGLRLHGRLLPLDHARGTIILFHGYHSFGDVDFGCAVPLLRSMGYQLLLADQRAHQDSEGTYLTFGVRERYDALFWAREVEKRFGKAHPIYLEGMSMGASTVLMAADLPLPESVHGIIADCGYTSPAAIIGAVMKKMKVPKLVLYLTQPWCRLLAGFSMWGCSAPKALQNSRVPILLIHGTADNFVPCAMSEENYAACTAPKQMFLAQGADHGASFLIDREGCAAALRSFFERTQKNTDASAPEGRTI